MADSLSVSSISLASAARLAALVPLLPVAEEERQSAISALDSQAGIVVLSEEGLLLSAVAGARTQLADALADAATDEPAALGRLAQVLVDTFNTLQSLGDAPGDILPGGVGDQPADVLLAILFGQPGAAFLAEDGRLASLEGIGIGLQAALPVTSDSGLALQIDATAFAAALSDDVAATGETLRQAASALLDRSAAVEAGVLAATSGLGAVSSALLPALSSEVLAGAIAQSGLLPDAGGDAATLLTDDGLLAVSSGTNPASRPGIETLAAASTLVDPATAEAIRRVRAGAVPDNVPGGPGASAVAASAAATVAPSIAAQANTASEVEAGLLRESTARLTLQNQLSAPGLTTLRTILDPYYAALVATARLSELLPLRPIVDARLLAGDFPAPVAPLQSYRGIDAHREPSTSVQS
jgi:hypothetical protein